MILLKVELRITFQVKTFNRTKCFSIVFLCPRRIFTLFVETTGVCKFCYPFTCNLFKKILTQIHSHVCKCKFSHLSKRVHMDEFAFECIFICIQIHFHVRKYIYIYIEWIKCFTAMRMRFCLTSGHYVCC